MPFRLPVRRFIQSTAKVVAPQNRFGATQWVLARPLYRFHVFDLAPVPVKSRVHALKLELTQWTPFAQSAHYVGWHGSRALVWAWDAAKTDAAITAHGLKPRQVRVVPETLLHPSLAHGLCIRACQEGHEGQYWRHQHLEHSRWWPQPPDPQEWLMFQRDAGIPVAEQQDTPPATRAAVLEAAPWASQQVIADDRAAQFERLAFSLAALALLTATLWYGFGDYKTYQNTQELLARQTQLRRDSAPIMQARTETLGYVARSKALLALAPYPEQLVLMEKIAQALPQDKSYLRDWDFQSGQLKVTITSAANLSTTDLVGAVQKTGAFRDVKALPARDPKSVSLQMDVEPR